MSADPRAETPRWSGTTYNGFSGPAPEAPAARRSRFARLAEQRPSTRNLMLGGVGAALALGLLFGALAKPEIKTPEGPARAPMQPVPSAANLPIEVGAPPPEQVVQPAGKLEVLPPDLARQARAQAQAQAQLQARYQAAAAPPPTDSAAQIPAVSYVAPPPAAPAPRPRASFDCAAARPGAEQLVCSDSSLAAADRQLAQAYRRALQAGAPAGMLRDDQRDWMDIREDAARRGPRAVANIYDQRIQELNELAEDGGGY